MTDIEREALCNEIDFLQKEVDKYREQNKKLVEFIFKMKKQTMSYDIDMCTGHRDNTISICPFGEKCKRYILGKKAVSENNHPIWWIVPPYEDGKCEHFIEIRQ